jgi:hypothetical protein
MNKEQIFERVWEHFIKNNNPPAVTRVGQGHWRGLLRGPNGAKCAIGLFISDDRYTPNMEMQDINQVVFANLKFADQQAADTLAILQHEHDLCGSCEELFHEKFRKSMMNVATRFNIPQSQFVVS